MTKLTKQRVYKENLTSTEAYVFTPEELGEILTKYITEVNKESITSQLIEFLKELK